MDCRLKKLTEMNMHNTLSIAIIDKHPILRIGLDFILKHLYYESILLESVSISAFKKTYPDQNPDLIILAIGQTDSGNNLAFINSAKKWYNSANIIVYDEESDPCMVSDYLDAGVHGYVSKQGKITELVACILDVMDGNCYVRV